MIFPQAKSQQKESPGQTSPSSLLCLEWPPRGALWTNKACWPSLKAWKIIMWVTGTREQNARLLRNCKHRLPVSFVSQEGGISNPREACHFSPSCSSKWFGPLCGAAEAHSCSPPSGLCQQQFREWQLSYRKLKQTWILRGRRVVFLEQGCRLSLGRKCWSSYKSFKLKTKNPEVVF